MSITGPLTSPTYTAGYAAEKICMLHDPQCSLLLAHSYALACSLVFISVNEMQRFWAVSTYRALGGATQRTTS